MPFDSSLQAAASSGSIAALVDEVARLLPSQSPLHAFVHHNTLRAYEDLPFKNALRRARRELKGEPFASEEAFLEAAQRGRMLLKDLDAVLEAELRDLDRPLFPGAPTRRAILLWRLTTLFNVPQPHSVSWWLHEKGYLDRSHRLAGSAAISPASPLIGNAHRRYLPQELRALWTALESHAPQRPGEALGPRPRDAYLAACGLDSDEWVRPLLIRLAAAYLDQGVASSAMPDRALGFLRAFRRLQALPGQLAPDWATDLRAECARQEALGLDAAAVIEEVLSAWDVPALARHPLLRDTALALKGWAGMFRQFETHPERAPVSAFPATLLDYLAVQLTLDACACRHAQRESGLSLAAARTRAQEARNAARLPVQDIYEGFVTAQAFDLPPGLFQVPEQARAWVAEIARFDSFERRWLLHLAYERRHRQHVLDGLAEHAAYQQPTPRAPVFQALFCMDEREESLRRHVEEVEPGVETFGYAGYFGVAMQYRGFEDVTSRPLCPVALKPAHYVEEVAIDARQAARWLRLRKWIGSYSRTLLHNEHWLSIGPAWSLLAGLAKTPALILRSLFPRVAQYLLRRLEGLGPQRPATRLALFRGSDQARADGLLPGFSVEEAAAIVAEVLGAMGLRERFASLVLVAGHGSSSLNNPHAAAYDCGATGGGRGGPNGRAFAAMANHPGVRARLAERGFAIPADTWFLGGLHNTSEDSMEYYDVDLLPPARQADFARLQERLRQACARDAQERCRRFEEVPVDVSEAAALRHVLQHAVDLAQPRPEYGHGSNAICFVGRRDGTRGLFLDRRAFLVSYDPANDPDQSVLGALLESAGVVGAGINLEYYFSHVDPVAWGCGTKLPHNITGLLGVMEGQSSDLRSGLPWQTVEIHEPLRMLTIVEASPAAILRCAQQRPALRRLIENAWIQVVAWDPADGRLYVYGPGGFTPHQSEAAGFPVAAVSRAVFRGSASWLGLAHIVPASESPSHA